MNTLELKKSLQNSINTIDDEQFLEAVYVLVKEYISGETIGAVGETTLTRADLLKKEKQADDDIKAGRVHSLDEVKSHFKKK